jgi:hypothetical protein
MAADSAMPPATQLSTCILLSFVSCRATDLHHRLLPQSGKQRLPGAGRHLPRLINKGNFRNGQSVTGHDLTAPLRNPVKELRKLPMSIRCRSRLFHIHFPYSKKCIGGYLLNLLLPQSQSDHIRSIPHSHLRRWRPATRPSETSSPSARHASPARRRPGGTSDPWSSIHWAIAGRQAVGGSHGTRHPATSNPG